MRNAQRLCVRRNVWLNQYSSQLLPILALIGLRLFVGLGDRFLRLVTKPKKDPMQASRLLTRRNSPFRTI